MDQIRQLVLALCEHVPSRFSPVVATLAERGEWTQVQDLSLGSPTDYDSADDYHASAIVVELLRKCLIPGVADENLLREGAVRTFLDSEDQCRRTNLRMRDVRDNPAFRQSHGRVFEFVTRWRKRLRNALGKPPSTLVPRFSGGATMSDKAKRTTLPDKLASIPTTYPLSHRWVPQFWDTAWGRAVQQHEYPIRYITYNTFFTVPKDSKKVRGCCKEASLALAYQLALGQELRVALRRLGIDLRDGKELHMALAREGSVDGRLATVDLSNASDTIAYDLVKLVVPQPWFEVLDSLRAPETFVDELGCVTLEKFSSMGNGFTFELETLLFHTLAQTVVEVMDGNPRLVSTFGDDIVLPSKAAPMLLDALRFFGFTPNERKTFISGPFRESCGGDYFDGVPVRAFYLEEIPTTPQQWIALANGLRALNRPQWTAKAWRYALKQIPTDIRRCRGPEGLGDIVIHDIEAAWQIKARGLPGYPPHPDGLEEVKVRCYRPIHQSYTLDRWGPHAAFAALLAGANPDEVIPRGEPLGFKLGWVSVLHDAFPVDNKRSTDLLWSVAGMAEG